MTADSEQKRVSVIIVAFHRPMSLRRLLRRLEHPAFEIVVVNVEADPAIAALGPTTHVINVPTNPGYAAAVNLGASAASAPVVVFMNDDVELSSRDIELLADVIGSGRADVAVPSVRDASGKVELTIAALPTPAKVLLEWALLPDAPVRFLGSVVRPEKWRCPARPERIDAASAVVVATSRALLADVPMPEAYFLYWEESEWFFDLRERGCVVEYRPDVIAVHHGGREVVRPDKSALLARNAVRCVRRTQGRWRGLAALLVVVVWQLRLTSIAVARRRLVEARLAGLRAALGAWRELR